MSLTQVREILKQVLGLKYKKVKRVMYTANREKNLVLRYEYAKVLIGLLESRTRIINIDETWIGESDFLRRKW